MGPVDYLKGDGPNQQVRAAASVSLRFCYLILSILLTAGHINFVFITGWLDIVFRGPSKFAAVFVIQKPYNFS